MRARLEARDLTIAGYALLFVLRRLPGLTNADLARIAGLAPQTSLPTIRSLVERGLVERRASEAKRQLLENYLTPDGERVIATCELHATEIEDTMSRDFDESERQQLESLLERCARNLGINLYSPDP